MPEEPDWGTRTPRGPQTFAYNAPGTPRLLGLEWISPPETRHDTAARYADHLAASAVTALLGLRLDAAVHAPGSALVNATVTQSDAFKTSHTVLINIAPKPGQAKAAFDQAYAVLRTFRDQGVTDTEVKLGMNALAGSRAQLNASYTGRSNRTIADNLIAGLGSDTVTRDLPGVLAQADAAASHIDKAGIDAAIKTVFAGDGPVLLDYGETTADLDPVALKAEYLAQTAAPAAVYKEAAVKPWPYADFGPARAAVSHSRDRDFGYDHFVYGNGVVLNVKSTQFTPGQVYVGVSLLGGMLRFDPKTPRPLRLAASADFFFPGGLGKLDATEITTTLAGKTYSYQMGIDGDAATLSGATTPSDFGTQLQMLMAYITDPGLRGDAYARAQAGAPETQMMVHASVEQTLYQQFGNVVTPGDWRFDGRTADLLATVPWTDIAGVYRDLLRDTPIVITVVGDVDPQTAADQVARTFATLPPRPAQAREAPGAAATPRPLPGEHVVYTVHNSGARTDNSAILALWPTTGLYADIRASHQLDLLAQVMRDRLFDTLREKLGADYTPAVVSYMSNSFPDYGYLSVRSAVKTGDAPLFRDTLAAIVADLRSHPIDDDELARVKTPILQAMRNQDNTNDYWYSTLISIARQPQARAAALRYRADIEGTRPADLMALANRYLKDDTETFIRVEPRPEPLKWTPKVEGKRGFSFPRRSGSN